MFWKMIHASSEHLLLDTYRTVMCYAPFIYPLYHLIYHSVSDICLVTKQMPFHFLIKLAAQPLSCVLLDMIRKYLLHQLMMLKNNILLYFFSLKYTEDDIVLTCSRMFFLECVYWSSINYQGMGQKLVCNKQTLKWVQNQID